MYIKVLCTIVILCSAVVRVASVQAHELETSGEIGIVMHIDPDDDPIVGQPATLFFDFKDKDSQFDGAGCECRVTIKENGATIFTGTLTVADFHASLQYTFPRQGIYVIELAGTPTSGKSFAPFTVSYDVRVARQGSGQVPGSAPVANENHNLHYALFGVGFVIIGLLYWRDRRKLSKERKS